EPVSEVPVPAVHVEACQPPTAADVPKTQPARRLRPIRAVAFDALAVSPDGTHAAAADGRTVRVWNVTTGERLPAFQGQTGPIAAIAFSPDGAVMATVGTDGVVHVWEVATGVEFCAMGQPGDAGALTAVAFSADDLHLAAGGPD